MTATRSLRAVMRYMMSVIRGPTAARGRANPAKRSPNAVMRMPDAAMRSPSAGTMILVRRHKVDRRGDGSRVAGGKEHLPILSRSPALSE